MDELFDRVMGLPRVRRPDMEHKVPLHAPRSRIEVHIIVRDLREHEPEQLLLFPRGFFHLPALFLFSLPEHSKAVPGQDLSFPGRSVHEEPEYIPPVPSLLLRVAPLQEFLRGTSHPLHAVQYEFRVCQENSRSFRNSLKKFQFIPARELPDLFPDGFQGEEILLFRDRSLSRTGSVLQL